MADATSINKTLNTLFGSVIHILCLYPVIGGGGGEDAVRSHDIWSLSIKLTVDILTNEPSQRS